MVNIKRRNTSTLAAPALERSADVIVREFAQCSAMLVISPLLSALISHNAVAMVYFYDLMGKLSDTTSSGKLIWVVNNGLNTQEGVSQFINTQQLMTYFKALKPFLKKLRVADWVFGNSVVVLFDPHRPSIKAANGLQPNFSIAHAMFESLPHPWINSKNFNDLHSANSNPFTTDEMTFTLLWSPHHGGRLPDQNEVTSVYSAAQCGSLAAFAHASWSSSESRYILVLHTIYGQLACQTWQRAGRMRTQ